MLSVVASKSVTEPRLFCPFPVSGPQISDEIKYLPTLYPGDSVFAFKWAYKNAQLIGKPRVPAPGSA